VRATEGSRTVGRQCILLYIGAAAIKVVQLKVHRRESTLENFGSEPVPPPAIVDG